MPKGTLKINGGCKYKSYVFQINNNISGFVNHDIPIDALGQILFFVFVFVFLIQAKHSVNRVKVLLV
jgi:hypothetical protein